jgi:stage III sporulation protein SpoIIIAA
MKLFEEYLNLTKALTFDDSHKPIFVLLQQQQSISSKDTKIEQDTKNEKNKNTDSAETIEKGEGQSGDGNDDNGIDYDLRTLIDVLPPHIAERILQHPLRRNLTEVVMDLGRVPTARFVCAHGHHHPGPIETQIPQQQTQRLLLPENSNNNININNINNNNNMEVFSNSENSKQKAVVDVTVNVADAPVKKEDLAYIVGQPATTNDDGIDHHGLDSGGRGRAGAGGWTVSKVGEFGMDNRAGIDSTLHRISRSLNRHGRIIGLTCRVGRAVYGAANIIQDLVAPSDGRSLLILGSPGTGKTTLLRDICRTLADEHHQRVLIVDTSNEIGGDGDIPHPGIGSARRLQVPSRSLQHAVMIEAVCNHTPQCIVVDEITNVEEAAAAQTIAQRGIRIIATTHGAFHNFVKNPILAGLVGGIETVTVGDSRAKRTASGKKSSLERVTTPTFGTCVEVLSADCVVIYRQTDFCVDELLQQRPCMVQVRRRTPNGFTAHHKLVQYNQQ